MPHPRISSEEIDRRGQELYERQIRDHVETQENLGKQIVIDIETGEYEQYTLLTKAECPPGQTLGLMLYFKWRSSHERYFNPIPLAYRCRAGDDSESVV